MSQPNAAKDAISGDVDFRKARDQRWRTRLRWALATLVAGATAAGIAALTPPGARSDDPFLRRTPTVAVVQKVGPTVVNITTEQRIARQSPFRPFAGDPTFERFFRDFFAPHSPETVQSLGSGVLIDSARHVITNEHVVARASRIRVTLADGRAFDARLIGADANHDLAVLEVETDEDLPWQPIGSSADLLVGEPVIAIGNPFGLSNSVTTGVISAMDRSIRADDHVYHGFLQTDASINPGNSGGPLLNAEGTLIAINTAIYSGAQGIGFAIPAETAKRVVRELIEYGEVQPVWLGIEFQDMDPALHQVMDLPQELSGALVRDVRTSSPASLAGVRRGDVVLRLDGRPVQSARDFFEMLTTVTNDQLLEMEVWRDGQPLALAIRAREFPDNYIAELAERLLGMQLEERPRGGFNVTEVRQGSSAERTGFEPGDILLAVNGRSLVGIEGLRRALLNVRGHPRALIVVQRGNGRYNVTLPLV